MFLLESVCKDYIWGGHKLAEQYNKGRGMPSVAESWELSTHPDGLTLLLGEGQTLLDRIKAEPALVGESVDVADGLPILVKLIDAKQPLSVQVHPDDSYAASVGQRGKTELWYVLHAEPGAYLYLGVNRSVSRAEFESKIHDKTVETILKKVPVKAGECYYIPSGMLHAIGGECLIYEVQQSSNLTYRVYDYGRVGVDGKPRQLHIEEALSVAVLAPMDAVPPGADDSMIVDCPYFSLRKVSLSGAEVLFASAESFCHILCVSGEAAADDGENELFLAKGSGLFLPAGKSVKLQGAGTFLVAAPGHC